MALRSLPVRHPELAPLRLAAGAAVVLLCPAWAVRAPAQEFGRGPVHSPHGQLSIPCSSCHNNVAWKPLRAVPEFDHNRETRFALRGMHQDVKCSQCHLRLVFAQVGTQCVDCHADIHRRQFGAKCQECHTVRGWGTVVQGMKAHQNRFPLLGAHAVVDCESCHRGAAQAVYTGLSTDCASCHLKDYETARPLDHRAAGLPVTCDRCHGMDNWRALSFDHARFTKFPLDGAHATVDCATCHVGGRFQGTPADCFSCHVAQFTSTRDPDHVKAGFPKDCSTCHSVVNWSGARFDHAAMTKFALTGAHAQVDCAACHVGGRFAGTPTDCYGCHASDYQRSKNPNHSAAKLPTDCATCHTTAQWQGAKFDHTLARFQLTGAHLRVECAQCHVGHQFTGTPSQCQGCHLTDYNKTTKPSHAAAGLPTDCALCHNTIQWQGAKFDHSKTPFALTGAHATLDCAQCHLNNKFAGTPAQCSGCHLTDFNGAKDPNHVAAGFPQDCALCHNTSAWTAAQFDHSRTKFPLTGMHATQQCSACHASGQFATLDTSCASCHMKDFTGAKNPNHVAAGFPQDCSICHTTSGWQGATFDHSRTRFPLTGMHATQQCSACHASGQFATLDTSCASCHMKDFTSAKNPNHVAAGFPQDCSICHTTAGWQPATFDHSRTKFPLTGMHATQQCSACHASGQFATLSTACVSCHLTDFNGAKNPNHVAAGFPQDCSICHTTSGWQPATFDHSRTKFPLTGMHATQQCSACHASGQFATLSTACASCHLKDFNGAKNPNHVAAGFPQDCSMCHGTTAWQPATFDHSQTKFPLTGAHATQQCSACHASGQFSTLSTACVSCHLANYNQTQNPNHTAAGFPQQCEVCHNTTAWQPASFDHSSTGFPLTGLHAKVQCALCHIGGRYAGTPTNCYACHSTEYNSTTNPNHVAAGFPQDCSLCHTTAGWSGATFNHDKFPIYSGTHAGKWTTCGDCHTNPNDYSVFSCTNCHAHDKTSTDRHHSGVRGYVYNSINCYSCHPRGNGG